MFYIIYIYIMVNTLEEVFSPEQQQQKNLFKVQKKCIKKMRAVAKALN